MLSDRFTPDELRRGRELIANVRFSSASDTLIRALVKDARVSLQSEHIESPTAAASCSCTQGRKGHLCKHLAAAVLSAEDRGLDFVTNKTEIEVNAAEVTPRPTPKKFERPKKEKPAKIRPPAFAYPAEVEEARAFFKANGFDFSHPLELEDLMNAKKLLMRVFHPDKGGSHDETVELNRNFEAIRSYLQS